MFPVYPLDLKLGPGPLSLARPFRTGPSSFYEEKAMSNQNPHQDGASDPASRKGPDKVTFLILGVLVAAVVGLVIRAIAVMPEPLPDPGEHARIMPVPRLLPEFSLTDHQGEAFGLDRLQGDWSLLFFGYTSCPDICPFVLGELARVKKTFDASTDVEGAMPNVVFVSVDPGRDSQARLAEYMQFFDPSFTGVTGSNVELQKLALGVGAYFEAPDETETEGYLVNHASKLFLVDEQGRFLALLDDPHDPDEFIDVLAKVQFIGGQQP